MACMAKSCVEKRRADKLRRIQSVTNKNARTVSEARASQVSTKDYIAEAKKQMDK